MRGKKKRLIKREDKVSAKRGGGKEKKNNIKYKRVKKKE